LSFDPSHGRRRSSSELFTGLTFEVMEVVFRVGIFDIDDVILNAFGVVVGYGAFVMFKRRVQPRLR
jgi:glycopeptide antibiotics resistance protein